MNVLLVHTNGSKGEREGEEQFPGVSGNGSDFWSETWNGTGTVNPLGNLGRGFGMIWPLSPGCKKFHPNRGKEKKFNKRYLNSKRRDVVHMVGQVRYLV